MFPHMFSYSSAMIPFSLHSACILTIVYTSVEDLRHIKDGVQKWCGHARLEVCLHILKLLTKYVTCLFKTIS